MSARWALSDIILILGSTVLGRCPEPDSLKALFAYTITYIFAKVIKIVKEELDRASLYPNLAPAERLELSTFIAGQDKFEQVIIISYLEMSPVAGLKVSRADQLCHAGRSWASTILHPII